MTDCRTIALPYGHGYLECPVPPHADILTTGEPEHTVSRAAFLAGLEQLLPPILPQGSIALVVADKTRLCSYPTVLPWLTDALLARGAYRQQITFYIAYGTHTPQSAAECLAAYGPICADYRFIHHHCTSPVRFAELGRTSRGTEVRIRDDLLEADLIITIGAISHHYFAGFGGGRKLLFPGLGEREAIYQNHRLFLDTERRILAAGCRAGQLQGNPVAEDLAEIDRLLPPYRSIHGLLDSSGKVAVFRFGTTYADFLAVCREHDSLYRDRTGKQYDLILASAGGFPKDINFIQAHKAIDNAASFVRDGGTLILLAACPDGIGSTTFLPYFTMGSRKAAFDHLTANYSGNGGTALAMQAKTERIRILLVTELDEATCQCVGVTPICYEQIARHAANGHDAAVITNASLLIG